MRPAGAAMLACVCLAATWAAPAGAGAQTLDERVSALLDKARAAATPDEAEPALQQAERLLGGPGATISPTARAFLEADVLRTRGQLNVAAWRRDATQAGRRDQALSMLAAALDAYQRLLTQAEDEANRIADKAGAAADLSKDRRYREAEGNTSRATYSLAWTRYHLGLATEGAAERAKHLDAAADAFQAFTDEGYRNHPIVAECFLGWALCLYEKGDRQAAVKVLEPATAANTPRGVFRQMTLLRVKAVPQGAGSPRQVEEAAAAYFDSLPADYCLDPTDLALAVERARALAVLAGDKADPAGAAALRTRLHAVKRAVYACGDPWAAELAKVLGEPPPPSATRHLGDAVARYKARRYKEALAAADAGLGIGKAGPVAVDLQYIRVASLVALERWREGHLAAAEFLRMAPKDPRSPDVCRRALDAGLKALKADPPLDLEAFDRFLTFAQTAFADVAEVRDAPWIRASQFLEAGRYREAERVLRDIAPSSPLYLRAQYGLALAAYRQAEGLLEGDAPDPEAAVHLGRAVAATRRFIDATPTRVPESDQPVAEQVAAIAMAAGQRLLGLPNADPAAAEALINRLDGWRVLGNPADRPHDALRLALALRSGRIDLALEQANDLIDRARPRDARVVGALLGAADPFESQSARLRREGQPAEAARIDATLRRMYEFLLARAGKADDAALGDQVVTIRRRLGHVLVRLGRPADAVVHYEWVLANSPREKAGDVLRGLALAREMLRQYDKAVESWDVLARGLKADTDGWFEARYHLALCHWEAGRWDHARRLMAYFRLRHPEGAPGRWKKEFEALHEKMEKAAGGKPIAEPLGP